MYTVPKQSIYAGIQNAGNNTCIFQTEYAMGLVARLDAYEQEWIEREFRTPELEEESLHARAMRVSGLTEEGLCTARAYAGKKASWKPGIFHLKSYAK